MSCALCAARNGRKETGFCLLPATEDMAVLLARVLEEHRIPFQRHRNLFGLLGSEGSAWLAADFVARVVALLRQVLSEPERLAVAVVRAAVVDETAVAETGVDFPQPLPLDEWWNVLQTDWFAEALAADRFESWFQPIVDSGGVFTGSGSPPVVLAHECLIRLNAGRAYSGAEIVEAARTRHQVHAFDSYARTLSIRSAAKQSPQGRYFINFMASSIYNPELCMVPTMAALEASGMKPDNVVFELTEADQVRDSAHLRRICDYFRSCGFGFALDNMGTGANSPQLMCDLRPDFIKLDRKLVAGVEQPLYAATIRKLVELAHRFGTVVIAEGVERKETMENLWLLGVQWMQGYLFGRPSPLLCEEACKPRISHRTGFAPVRRPHRAASLSH